MNWLKKMAIDFAANYAKKFLTVENILNWCSLGLTTLLRKIASDKDEDKVKRVCVACELYGAVLTEIAKSAKDGEITATEMAEILTKLQDATSVATLTDEKLAALIDKAVAALKEKL